MRPVPIPPDELPDGAQLDPSGLAYLDAIPVPISGVHDGISPHLAIPRTSQLIQASPKDVQAMAAGGWRFWIRWIATGAGMLVQAEPYTPAAAPNPFLNSDPEGH